LKVFALSDIHVDYSVNRKWLLELSRWDYREDVLILAGDLTDDLALLEQSLSSLCSKFRKVMFVPGNHELWVVRDRCKTSLDKFRKVIEIAENCGASTNAVEFGRLSIVPLFAWYDLSFGPLCEELENDWTDFHACRWPQSHSLADIAQYFSNQNRERLQVTNQVVISFSHFLPHIELMPGYIPRAQRVLYPVLGSTALGAQVTALKPAIHVYGHSHVNLQVEFGGIHYVNNAFGYPSERVITRKALLSIYEG
jgi:Icc-related predicted phosphoesterase